MKALSLSDVFKKPPKPGEIVHVKPNFSLVEEPLKIKILEIREKRPGETVSWGESLKPPVIVGVLLGANGEEGPKVVIKRMFVGEVEAPNPFIPHLLPHNVIGVEEVSNIPKEPEHYRYYKNAVLQLFHEEEPDVEKLAKDLAYLFARAFHYFGSVRIYDYGKNNVGERPYDVVAEPEEVAKRFIEHDGISIGLYDVLEVEDRLSQPEEKRRFRETFKEAVREFLQNPDKLHEYEGEQRRRLLELLKGLGYTPRFKKE